MRKGYILFLSTIISLLVCSNSYGQETKSSSENTVYDRDSVWIYLKDVSGNIQWEKSSDNINWTEIPEANNDTLEIIAAESEYIRAKITEANCDPIYSDTAFIKVEQFLALYHDTTNNVIIGADVEGTVLEISLDEDNNATEIIVIDSAGNSIYYTGTEDGIPTYVNVNGISVYYENYDAILNAIDVILIDTNGNYEVYQDIQLGDQDSFDSNSVVGLWIYNTSISIENIYYSLEDNSKGIGVGLLAAGLFAAGYYVGQKIAERIMEPVDVLASNVNDQLEAILDNNSQVIEVVENELEESKEIIDEEIEIIEEVGSELRESISKTVKRSISIQFPNATSIWTTGDFVLVSWTNTNLDGDVKIGLYKSRKLIANLSSGSIQNTGSFILNEVSDTYGTGNDFQIRISSVQYPDVFSYGAYFTIRSPEINNSPPGKPYMYFPNNNLTDVSIAGTDLMWSVKDPDEDIVFCDIYLGTSNPPALWRSDYETNSHGYFSLNTGGLNENTTYYWGIEAKDNISGASLSEVFSFSTVDPDNVYSGESCSDMPTVTDQDGNVYNTVQIGDQCWMKENLIVGTRIASTDDQTDNGIIEKYCYENNDENCSTYGGYYQWDELMNYTYKVGTQGICPDGWKIPSYEDWEELVNTLGGEAIAGGKLKLTGTEIWAYPNSGATNSTGFSAMPSGYYLEGTYRTPGGQAAFIASSTKLSEDHFVTPYTISSNPIFTFSWRQSMASAVSVRCIREDNIIPIAAFEASSKIIIAGESIQFSDQSTNEPTEWLWDFGDGGTSSEQFPSHKYSDAGAYTVTLIVSNSAGSDTMTKIDYITVNARGVGSITDIDGNIYNTVTIGTQEWMAENLKVTKYNDGSLIELVYGSEEWRATTSGAYNYLKNDIYYKDIYGVLYNWFTVQDSRGVCPEGWHVPSDDEWKHLEMYLGISLDEIENSSVREGRGTIEGNLLKAISGWYDNGNGTDEYGFLGLPSGLRNRGGGIYSDVQEEGNWWTSSESENDLVWYRKLRYDQSKVIRFADDKRWGFSIRCVKDSVTLAISPVATFTASPTSIIEGESVQFTDQSTNEPTRWLWDFGDGGTSTEQNPSHVYTVSGTYTVKLMAINDAGSDIEIKTSFITVTPSVVVPVAAFTSSDTSISEGDFVQFTDQSTNEPTNWDWDFGDGGTSNEQNPSHTYTTAGVYDVSLIISNTAGTDTLKIPEYITVNTSGGGESGTVTDIDGNVYQTVTIGTQEWMAENLKTTAYNNGTDINLVTDGTEWISLIDPAYCWYNNDESTNKDRYGALYNWFVVETGKVCPSGWHVPTNDEWNTLENYLIANGYNYDGTTIDNKIAKSLAAKTDWYSYTVVGAVGNDLPTNNSSGFSAIPSGRRRLTGNFENDVASSYWWSSTEYSADTNAYGRYLSYHRSDILYHALQKEYGFSIRCIKGDNVVQLPGAAFTASDTSITVGDSVQFTDQSTNEPTEWLWGFGDGGTSTEQNPSHTYTATGVYNVILTVSNSAGNNTLVISEYITVNASGGGESGSVTDIDGNVYQTVTIGTQEWMAENLKTTHYADGTPLLDGRNDNNTHYQDSGKYYYYYDNYQPNGLEYGCLYTWSAAVNNENWTELMSHTENGDLEISNVQGVCPDGWHLPSNKEWAALVEYVGGEEFAGGKLKKTGTDNWLSPNADATDEYEFGAVGSGKHGQSSFLSINYHGMYWTSSFYFPYAVSRYMTYFDGKIYENGYSIADGKAVRCVKDMNIVLPPVAAFTASPTSIIEGESVQFTDQSTNGPTSWEWDFRDGNPSTQQNPSHTYTTPGTYEVSLTVSNSAGSDTEIKSGYITVSNSGGGGTVTDIDGNVYQTVTIGTQEWMAENLKTTKYNDGTEIPLVTDETEWENINTPAYCWNDNDEVTYKDTYGAFYNWYTVNTGKLCPSGLHVPTDTEWKTLEMHLGMSQTEADELGYYRGTNEGSKLAGSSSWFSGVLSSNAEFGSSGFNALPGGYRTYIGSFLFVGDTGSWWSSTENSASLAVRRELLYNISSITRSNSNKNNGLSVRCIKD
ncbi:FISUMP domain-containing protein [Bacteroidota bacterium]